MRDGLPADAAGNSIFRLGDGTAGIIVCDSTPMPEAGMDISRAIDDGKFNGIPIVLGFVGHRDLNHTDIHALQSELAKLFVEFDKAFPQSPKILLTSLAPGADILVAKEVLKKTKWTIRAPLPFDLKTTRTGLSFQEKVATNEFRLNGAFHDEFDGLLEKHADRIEYFTVPLPDEFTLADTLVNVVRRGDVWYVVDNAGIARPATWNHRIGQSARTDEPELNDFNHACLANAGGYIVRHCHTLIALWDGVTNVFVTPDGKTVPAHDRNGRPLTPPVGSRPHPNGVPDCGAADMVRFQLGGLAPRCYPWTGLEPLGFDNDRGPVIQIETPRTPGTQSGRRTIWIPSPTDFHYWGVKAEHTDVAWRPSRFWPRVLNYLGEGDRHGEEGRGALARATDLAASGIRKVFVVAGWMPVRGRAEYEQFLQVCQATEDFNADYHRIRPDSVVYGQRLVESTRQLASRADVTFPRPATTLGSWYRRIAGAKAAAEHVCGGETEFKRLWKDSAPAPGSGVPGHIARLFVAGWRMIEHLRVARLESGKKWSLRILFVSVFLTVICLHAYSHPFWPIADSGHPNPIDHKIFAVATTLVAPVTSAAVSPRFSLWIAPHGHPGYLLIAFVGIWWVMVIGMLLAWFGRYDSRRMDYRALTESLRVRMCWAEAGLDRSVSDSYISQVRTDMVWIRRALQQLCPPPQFWKRQFDDPTTTADARLERLRAVKKAWVSGQKEYYRKAHRREHTYAVRFRRFALLSAGSGLVLYTVLATAGPIVPHRDDAAHANDHHSFSATKPPSTWLISGGLGFVAGGLLLAYSERRSFEALAKQYDQMFRIFQAGNRELVFLLKPAFLDHIRGLGRGEMPPDVRTVSQSIPARIARAQAVFERLGHEAIQEHAQWLLLNRSKPFELQLGG